jgi:hypothetical protein
MTTFQSEKKTILNNNKRIYDFLTDLTNFHNLLPDQVKDWKSTPTTCSFIIDGAGTLGFEIFEKEPFSMIRYKDFGNVPFHYDLVVEMEAVSETETTVQLAFEADLNAMLKMMLKKPLTNLLNMMIEKMETI